MNEKEYIDQRVIAQIKWYGKKSRRNKVLFYTLRSIDLISAALIPFLVNYITADKSFYKTTIEILGLAIVISTGMTSLFRFYEQWIQYRSTSELLKHELYLYNSGCFPYDSTNSFKNFVDKVEHIIHNENNSWVEKMSEGDHDHTKKLNYSRFQK